MRPPARPAAAFARGLPPRAALDWLARGWADLRAAPASSLAYGLFVVLLSYAVLALLYLSGLLYLALPAISGFLIIGPFFAIGLYEKSRRREAGQPISLGEMLLLRPASGGQLAYAGLLLGLLVLFWLRAADLLYALFFGITPFPGAGDALANVLTTARGWGLILTGGAVGALFAAFAFALSLFSIPMLLVEPRDSLTALGLSFSMTVQNLPVALAWGGIVAGGIALSVATGLLGLIVIFPVLGHGTWHAFRAIRGAPEGGPA
ncbi:cytochrome C oxidase subunit I [Paracoccus halophilus]|uniref:Cytochrome C oxidase subunit I n=1 Tax=Paracoccus halophilus TaxID=376733 RepID=A0A099F8H5_9RHOB|nr:cytochrome C oxidase subunit I [Paracoccus halophilus]